MKFTEEEKVFLITVLSNRLTYLERDYIHNQKRLDNIYSGDSNGRFESSLLLQKHKIDMCLDILNKLRIKMEGEN